MKNYIAVLLLSSAVLVGCSKQNNENETKAPANTSVTQQNSIIRSKDAIVADIDVNKDGKVFQCPMDSDVISDKQEPCPKCKMDLDEVSVEEAQKNLK